MTIKTVVEVIQLLKDLSGFTSLSNRVKEECKEAVDILDNRDREIAVANAPIVVIHSKPPKKCDKFLCANSAEMIKELNDISTKFELFNICVTKKSYNGYLVCYQVLLCSPILLWTYKKIQASSLADIIKRAEAWPNEMQLLYIATDSSFAIIRER